MADNVTRLTHVCLTLVQRRHRTWLNQVIRAYGSCMITPRSPLQQQHWAQELRKRIRAEKNVGDGARRNVTLRNSHEETMMG